MRRKISIPVSTSLYGNQRARKYDNPSPVTAVRVATIHLRLVMPKELPQLKYVLPSYRMVGI